jgi:hypothetical protein
MPDCKLHRISPLDNFNAAITLLHHYEHPAPAQLSPNSLASPKTGYGQSLGRESRGETTSRAENDSEGRSSPSPPGLRRPLQKTGQQINFLRRLPQSFTTMCAARRRASRDKRCASSPRLRFTDHVARSPNRSFLVSYCTELVVCQSTDLFPVNWIMRVKCYCAPPVACCIITFSLQLKSLLLFQKNPKKKSYCVQDPCFDAPGGVVEICLEFPGVDCVPE